MNRKCVSCGEITLIPTRMQKCLDYDGPFCCSLPCVKNWVLNDPCKRSDPLSLTDNARWVGEIDLGPPDDGGSYSRLLDKYFRSAFERNCADWFFCEGLPIRYEKIGFKWGTKLYCPDFYFPEYKSFIEIKGLWQCSNRSKYANFREVFPEVNMMVIPWTMSEEAQRRTENLHGFCYFGGCVK